MSWCVRTGAGSRGRALLLSNLCCFLTHTPTSWTPALLPMRGRAAPGHMWLPCTWPCSFILGHSSPTHQANHPHFDFTSTALPLNNPRHHRLLPQTMSTSEQPGLVPWSNAFHVFNIDWASDNMACESCRPVGSSWQQVPVHLPACHACERLPPVQSGCCTALAMHLWLLAAHLPAARADPDHLHTSICPLPLHRRVNRQCPGDANVEPFSGPGGRVVHHRHGRRPQRPL